MGPHLACQPSGPASATPGRNPAAPRSAADRKRWQVDPGPVPPDTGCHHVFSQMPLLLGLGRSHTRLGCQD